MTKSLVHRKTSWTISNSKPVKTLTNTLGLALVLVALFSLFEPCSADAQELDPAQSIEQMQNTVKPMLEHATVWSTKVCIGLMSGYAFYVLAIKVTNIGN
jgi:hypothetical protein